MIDVKETLNSAEERMHVSVPDVPTWQFLTA